MANRFVRLLEFANNQFGSNNAWTLSELDDLQYLHEAWYTSLYTIDDILRKHGITHNKWGEVIAKNCTWYSCSSPEEDVVNNEIKAHIKKVVGYLPAQTLESQSVFSGQLSTLFRLKTNKRIQRFKGTDGLFRYWIKEA